jgi:hypothetical protein
MKDEVIVMNAADKRFNALKAFCDKYWPESNDYKFLSDTTDEQLTADIESMRSLGRTERWQAVLTKWQGMVNTCDHGCESVTAHLDWAAMQGSTYANYERL